MVELVASRRRPRAKTRTRPKPARTKARTASPPRKRAAASNVGHVVEPTTEPWPPPPTAEPLLLALARELTARGPDVASAEQFHALVVSAFAAYGPDTVLASALREDWLRGRGDKSASLALGWAREQVRLALVDALVRARGARLVRADTDVDTLGWLWLAACEALAHEVPGAVTDRVQAFAAFLAAS
jgi:hypothetical protein